MDTISKKEIDDYLELKKQYTNIVNTNILENCNKIVQIGAYTAEVGKNNSIILSRNKFPSQFAEKSANDIVNMNWTSSNNKKANVEVYNIKDWYRGKIEALDFIIKNYNIN